MERNMPPRCGFSSFGVGGYNYVAPTELKNGSSAAVRTGALIQRQWSRGEGERIFQSQICSTASHKDPTSLPQSKVDAKSPANKMTAVSKIKL